MTETKVRKCYACGSARLVRGTRDRRLEVDSRTFIASQPFTRCEACGESISDGRWLHAFELEIARTIATDGPSTGDGFRFMRKAIGLQASELAELLDVTRETVSRWENEKQDLERRAVAILSSLVLETVEGRRLLLDRLHALRNGRAKLAKTVRIEPGPDAFAASEAVASIGR
ncbi:MAG: type II TA system antitoxin MqsA family protein [Polyangiales bacterium]